MPPRAEGHHTIQDRQLRVAVLGATNAPSDLYFHCFSERKLKPVKVGTRSKDRKVVSVHDKPQALLGMEEHAWGCNPSHKSHILEALAVGFLPY